MVNALSPDGHALLALAGGRLIPSWNAADPNPCAWHGVSCRASDSRVVSVSLSGTFLHTFIPAEAVGSPELMSELRVLNLSSCNLTGPIPPELGNASHLEVLDLSSNLLSGPVPPFVGGFASLATLDLSNNRLRGAIPRSFTGLLALTGLNLSYNNLSGRIPHGPPGMSRGAYEGNPLLCGPPLPVPCAPRADGHMDKKVVAALVIGALAVSVVALAICAALAHQLNWGRGDAAGLPSSSSSKKKKKKKMTMMTRDLILGGSGDETHDDIGDGKLMRFEGGEHLGVDDVLNAPGEVLGKTSYGTVYKAKLGGGASMIALRLLREDTVKEKDEFMLGIRHLGQIRHPNVASLLAYYAGPKGEKLLVYNYLSRGSLFDLLYSKWINKSVTKCTSKCRANP